MKFIDFRHEIRKYLRISVWKIKIQNVDILIEDGCESFVIKCLFIYITILILP